MIKLQRLLKNSIKEIDILEEYYTEQHITTIKYIEKEMEQYKYGLAIYKFLCGRIHKEEKPPCMNEDDERFISEELIIMEDEYDKEKVEYKLKNQEKYAEKYELDPVIAERKCASLIERPEILNNSVIIMLLIRYESIISNIYKKLLIAFPNAYLKDKSITYDELISFNSDIEEIKKAFIDSEIDEFMRKPLKEWYTTFEQKHGLHFDFADEFEHFKEIYYRRNVVVHNQGRANSVYLSGVSSKYACEIGERLVPSKDYLLEAIDCTRIVVIETILGLIKLASDKSDVVDTLFSIGFRYMLENKWTVSKYIFNALMNLGGQNDADLWRTKVNYFICCKNIEGLDNIRATVEKEDTSLMVDRLAIAKPALLDEFTEVTKILENIIGKEISVNSIKTWPMFIQYRESNEYSKLVERHKDLFEIETCSTQEIICLSEQEKKRQTQAL